MIPFMKSVARKRRSDPLHLPFPVINRMDVPAITAFEW